MDTSKLIYGVVKEKKKELKKCKKKIDKLVADKKKLLADIARLEAVEAEYFDLEQHTLKRCPYCGSSFTTSEMIEDEDSRVTCKNCGSNWRMR